MNRFEGIRPSAGRTVLWSILALVLGILQPLAIIFQLMLPAPAISLAMILSVAMYGSCGIIPVAVYGVTATLSCVLLYGLSAGMISMLLWIVPAIVIMRGIRRRDAFFGQLTKGIAVAVVTAVLAIVCMAAIFGSGLIADFIDHARQNFADQQELMWQVLSPMFSAQLSMDQFVEMYYTAFNTLQLYYEYYLTANLVCGAIASACIAVLWGNWKVAKRGLATPESYRGLSLWHLPANTTWGLLMMLAAGFVLSRFDFGAAKTAWIMVQSICQLAFVIQFLSALDRRMKRGSGYAARTVMMALLMIMGYSSGMVRSMAILGGVSALFGSKGAAKPVIEKFKDNTDGEDR